VRHLFITLLLILGSFQALWAEETTAQRPTVVLETTQGPITLELYPDIAPLAVENFTTHIKNGYYDGIAFHRIIAGFMIQGGDPTESGYGGESIWGKPFKDEFGPNIIFDRPGILAMANAGRGTNRSQFFITLAPTPHLNGRHTIFGRVIEGMENLRRLGSVPTGPKDRPLQRQEIVKATVK
jgi:peptidylprolyl isomerase